MRFNELLSSRWNNLLKGIMPVDEQEGVVTLGGDLTAGIELQSDRPEWGFLLGEKYCEGSASVGPIAAQNPSIELFLPNGPGVASPGSAGILVVVNTFIVSSTLAQLVSWGQFGGALATIVAQVFVRDPRFAQNIGQAAITQVRTATQVGLNGDGSGRMQIAAGVPMLVPGPWFLYVPRVLASGCGLVVNGGLINSDLSVTFKFREYTMQKGENPQSA